MTTPHRGSFAAEQELGDDEQLYVPLRHKLRQQGQGRRGPTALEAAVPLSPSDYGAELTTSGAAATSTARAAESKRGRVSAVPETLLEQTLRSGGQPEPQQTEAELIANLGPARQAPLLSAKEAAHGHKHFEPLQTGWTVPSKYRRLREDEVDRFRTKLRISIQGGDVPPPFLKFHHMRLVPEITSQLQKMGITKPTAIQMQCLPVALSGRDLIGNAYTGSGKTIVFVLPLIIQSLMAELKCEIEAGEGPFGLSLCPSRELATQTARTAQLMAEALVAGGYPLLRVARVIGGDSVWQQSIQIKRGVHIIVATPGRLHDLLNRKKLQLRQCACVVLDEADRLVDLGFDEELGHLFDSFVYQRQTLLFSATMPTKIQEFAQKSLVQPVVCVVGRAGAANLDVSQEVEYVKEEARLPYLLQCLQKTPPPVMIFCENKKDVDDVHEYLLLKGVEVAAIHGGLSQPERAEAVASFTNGIKDVLVGTDVASKGLDFPHIQHVINYDLPREIEGYVHRIGRTGRRGQRGIATTFVNKEQSETILLDLRALLIEAGQQPPAFLETLAASAVERGILPMGGDGKGCPFCGGLGHGIANCPKLQAQQRSAMGGDAGGGRHGESGW